MDLRNPAILYPDWTVLCTSRLAFLRLLPLFLLCFSICFLPCLLSLLFPVRISGLRQWLHVGAYRSKCSSTFFVPNMLIPFVALTTILSIRLAMTMAEMYQKAQGIIHFSCCSARVYGVYDRYNERNNRPPPRKSLKPE